MKKIILNLQLLPLIVFQFAVACSTPQEKLFGSIEKNDIKSIGLALEEGADINAPLINSKESEFNKNGTINCDHLVSPIMLAIKKHKPKILSFLLKNGSNPSKRNYIPGFQNVCDSDYRWLSGNITPLHFSLFLNLEQESKDLLKKNVNVNSPTLSTIIDSQFVKLKNIKPIDITVRYNNLKLTKLLLEKGANPNSMPLSGQLDQKSFSPLSIAAINSNRKMVELLLKFKANVNIRHDMATPVLDAAQHGNEEIVFLLLKNGAPIHSKTNGNETLLHFAAYSGLINLSKFLIKGGVSTDSKSIYASGINSFYPDGSGGSTGFTPLHYATINSKKEIISLLVQNGARVNARNNRGWTPLYYAVLNKQIGAVKELCKFSADPNSISEYEFNYYGIPNSKNTTPLHVAVYNKDRNMVQFLLKKGANPKLRDSNKLTPFDWAIKRGSNEVIDLLKSYMKKMTFSS